MAGAAVTALTGRVLPPRRAVLCKLREPDSGALIDEALVLFFQGPASFTGEDCAEFQCHGSRAVQAALQAALAGMDGLRAAEAGEFSRQAFLAGKLDLAQAEGLADLIEAENGGTAAAGAGTARRQPEPARRGVADTADRADGAG